MTKDAYKLLKTTNFIVYKKHYTSYVCLLLADHLIFSCLITVRFYNKVKKVGKLAIINIKRDILKFWNIEDDIFACCCCLSCNHGSYWTVVEEIWPIVIDCILHTAGRSIIRNLANWFEKKYCKKLLATGIKRIYYCLSI